MTRILLPGRVLRHVADVGDPVRYQGGTWYPLTRLCDGSERLAGAQFISQRCETIDAPNFDCCYSCRGVWEAETADPAEDPTMGTIPLFDL